MNKKDKSLKLFDIGSVVYVNSNNFVGNKEIIDIEEFDETTLYYMTDNTVFTYENVFDSEMHYFVDRLSNVGIYDQMLSMNKIIEGDKSINKWYKKVLSWL